MLGVISVIVPIYNVEFLLPRCIESICKQTYKNLEIILVDDGSPDRSGQICDEYAKRDSRIKVVHKKNGGLSDARNAGIKVANGEFIAFVDSDDYIVNNAYEIMMKEARLYNLEIVASNAIVYQTEGTRTTLMRKKVLGNEVMKGLNYMCHSIEQDSFAVCVWLNLYKRELIMKNKFFFEKGLLHEDEEWTPRVFLMAERVKYIDYNTYVYVIREDSITNTKDKSKNGLDIINTCYKMEKIYAEITNKKQKKILMGYLLFIYLGGIYIGGLDRSKFNGKVSRSFVIGKANNGRDFVKSILFFISPKLYIRINASSKHSR